MLKLVCISDSHEQHEMLMIPAGDVLIHAGDITGKGSIPRLASFLYWMKNLPHKHKIIIAGNHDFCFENGNAPIARNMVKEAGIHYLQDELVEIEGYCFYGSPYQPEFYDWAFNLPRGEVLARKWAQIPERVEVLITHGPPFGILDKTDRDSRVGCEDLLRRVGALSKLKAHIFGHIHDAYGVLQQGDVTFVNACSCNEKYLPVNSPIVLDLPDKKDENVHET